MTPLEWLTLGSLILQGLGALFGGFNQAQETQLEREKQARMAALGEYLLGRKDIGYDRWGILPGQEPVGPTNQGATGLFAGFDPDILRQVQLLGRLNQGGGNRGSSTRA